jgi:hypothetical protein
MDVRARDVTRLLFVLFVAATGSLRAQTVRGTIRDSRSREAVRGAVVLVLDSVNAVLARTLADDRGQFQLSIGNSARRIRVQRIGFRPRDVELSAVAPDGDLEILMAQVPLLLAPVQVTGMATKCPARADGAAAWGLWEQVRSGLLATVVARDRAGNAKSLLFDRTLDTRREAVVSQTVYKVSGLTRQPFVAARSVEAFDSAGYMKEEVNGRTFFAPDAEILLHPTFGTSHCFSIAAADSLHSGAVGLRFEPIRRDPPVVDVSGVLWVNQPVASLRSLEFVYTDLEPAAIRARAGGSMTFRELANGVVFLDRWSIRIPVIGGALIPQGRSTTLESVPRAQRRSLSVIDVHEIGGEVAAVRWRDGTDWTDSLAGVRGRVVGGATRAPVQGAIVRLVGTDYVAVADSAGRFEIRDVLPGPYRITALDSSYEAFGASRSSQQSVSVTRGPNEPVEIELSPDAQVVADLCDRSQGVRLGDGVLLGKVGLDDGHAAPGVRIRIEWVEAEGRGANVQLATRRYDALTGADGSFKVCWAPFDKRLRLELRRGDLASLDTATTIPRESPIRTIRLQLKRR